MKRLGAILLLLATGTACGGLKDDVWWVDELKPSSPCYDVDLVDGLDDSSPDELHDLFACLNRFGHLQALEPVDAALDVETRTGTPTGQAAAGLVNHMADADLDPLAIAGVLLDALTSDDRPVDEILDLTLELGWGDRASRVRSGSVALDDPNAAADGVLVPLAPVIPVAATALLLDPEGAAAFAGDVLVDPETERWLRTIVSALESSDPTISEPVDGLLVHLGQAVAAARSPQNDRWPGASGDSVRDLVDFFVVQPNPVVDRISPAVDAMLSDPLVRQGMVPAIDGLVASGDLERVPSDVVWLASVDVDGTVLSPGEASALYRFVRLLADNNGPVDCSIDVFGFPILQWSFGNLAVETLRLVADLSPGTVQDLAGLISGLTGSPVTEELLSLAVDTGVCPELTQQTLDDLRALESLSQPEAESLLAGFVTFLHVLEGGSTDHIPAFADLAEGLFLAGGTEPLLEAVVDLGTEPLVDDLVELVPILLDPAGHGLNGGAEPPIDLRDVIVLVQWSFAEDPDTGLTGFQRLRPLMAPVLAEDPTWVALGNLAALMADDGTVTSEALTLIPRVVALDPELVLVRQLGPLLSDRALSDPLLRLLETDQLVDAVLAPPVPGGADTPLVFWGRLVVQGTLEDILRLVDTVLGGL